MNSKIKFGDRFDGKLIKMDGMHHILADFKPDRCDADVFINKKFDVTNLVKYMEKKKKENPDVHITYFHAFSMGIAKLLYNRPYMNRFVANRKYYQRDEVKLSFVAKVEFEDNAKELLCVLNVLPDYSLMDISKYIAKRVEHIREKGAEETDTNNAIDIIGGLPNPIRIPIIGFCKWLDKHGWLPKAFVNDNIYYSSVILSNLGSIKCDSIYHNLTNFGTNSILATMGMIHKEEIINEKGKKEIRDVVDFGINADERIADGVYFAKSLNLLQYIFDNPELLDGKASDIIEIK